MLMVNRTQATAILPIKVVPMDIRAKRKKALRHNLLSLRFMKAFLFADILGLVSSSVVPIVNSTFTSCTSFGPSPMLFLSESLSMRGSLLDYGAKIQRKILLSYLFT